MDECKALQKSMLGEAVELHVPCVALSFGAARKIADEEARKRDADPMLLAWYDRQSGNYSPRVE